MPATNWQIVKNAGDRHCCSSLVQTGRGRDQTRATPSFEQFAAGELRETVARAYRHALCHLHDASQSLATETEALLVLVLATGVALSHKRLQPFPGDASSIVRHLQPARSPLHAYTAGETTYLDAPCGSVHLDYERGGPGVHAVLHQFQHAIGQTLKGLGRANSRAHCRRQRA